MHPVQCYLKAMSVSFSNGHPLSPPSRARPTYYSTTKLGIRALVKELRELDIDSTPLLSNAAASRGKHSCFRTAYDLVLTVVGKGGLMEQVEAVDRLDRGILMHAARSNHVQTFREVFDMRKETAASAPTAPAADVGSATEEIGKVDSKGMNCLHHAAEAGCCEVLREVMAKCQQAGPSLYGDMNIPDNRGRTPIMLVLRNSGCYGEEEDTCDNNDLEEKFDMLFKTMPEGGEAAKTGWMDPTPVPPCLTPVPPRQTRAVTELMHAARGGLESLELALNKAARVDGGLTINLDDTLSVKELDSHDAWVPTDGTRTWGRALLLAAAAKRGDVDVLHHVLNAIDVC